MSLSRLLYEMAERIGEVGLMLDFVDVASLAGVTVRLEGLLGGYRRALLDYYCYFQEFKFHMLGHYERRLVALERSNILALREEYGGAQRAHGEASAALMEISSSLRAAEAQEQFREELISIYDARRQLWGVRRLRFVGPRLELACIPEASFFLSSIACNFPSTSFECL